VAQALTELEAKHFVLDGENGVPEGRGFSFDALLQRIHPAPSCVKRLAAETPAIYVVFDLLAVDDARLFRDRKCPMNRRSAPRRDRPEMLNYYAKKLG
jgi:ATP-dependent DNA ligase